MIDIKNRQYILITSKGEKLNLFFNNKLGICISTLNKWNKWTAPQSIIKNSLPNFKASIDSNDNIHILHQDNRGDIVYLVHANGVWSKFPVLTAKSPQEYDKDLCMCLHNDRIFIFYVLIYGGKNLLTMQEINEKGMLAKPKVLDYISLSQGSYNCFYDNQAIYLCYDRVVNDEVSCGFRILEYEDDQSVFTTVEGNQDLHFDSIIKDNSSNLYLFGKKRSKGAYEVHFIKWNIREKKVINSSVLVNDIDTADVVPQVCLMDGAMIYYHIRNNDLLYKISNDYGLSWSPRTVPAIYHFDNAVFAELHYSDVNEKQFLSMCNLVPIKFSSNGYSMVFNDINNRGLSRSSDISGSDNLYDSVNRIQKALENIEERILQLEKTQHHQGLEFEKAKLESRLAAESFSKLKKEINTF